MPAACMPIDQPAEPAAFDEMLVEHAKAKKPSPIPINKPGLAGSSLTPCTTTDLSDVPPSSIGWDISGRPALEPATRPPAAWVRGSRRGTGDPVPPGNRAATFARLVASEIDAVPGGDPATRPESKGEAALSTVSIAALALKPWARNT